MKNLIFIFLFLCCYSCSENKEDIPHDKKENTEISRLKNEKSDDSKCNCNVNSGSGNIISDLAYGSTYTKNFPKIDVEEFFKCIGHICIEKESFTVIIFLKRINKKFNLKQQNKLIFINSKRLYSFESDTQEELPDSVINCNFYFNKKPLKLERKLTSSLIFNNVFREDILYCETISNYGYVNCKSLQ